MTRCISIIGITPAGAEELNKKALAAIQSDEAIFGGQRHFKLINSVIPKHITCLSWKSPINRSFSQIESFRGKKVVILATGDPMVFGVGETLSRHFDTNEILVIPAPSAFSLVAARLLWSLSEVNCVSLHGRPIISIRAYLADGKKIIALSHDASTPQKVCKHLTQLGYGKSICTVLENMESDFETITTNTAEKWTEPCSSDLNTIAIEIRGNKEAKRFAGGIGLPDRAFDNSGLITKKELRILTLSALQPNLGQLLWDVGAGSGSISIEWLMANYNNRAIAIEKNASSCNLIKENASALGVPNLKIEHGEAPNALNILPDPDAIFIGGGLTNQNVLETCWSRLKMGGRLVANTITTSGEQKINKFSREKKAKMTRILISRSGPMGNHIGWRSLNPITQIEVIKK